MGILDTTTALIKTAIDRRLEKATGVPPMLAEPLEKSIKEDGYGRKGLMFDPFFDQGYAGGMFRTKGAGSGFISNFLLKIVSRRDPIVSTILHVRSNQVSAFCRRQATRFDTGMKVIANDGFEPDEKEINEIEEFLLNCGEKEERSEEDKLTFESFGYMVAHDMLTYGNCAIELIKNRGNDLHAFLPLPAESIYYANKKLINKKQIDASVELFHDVAEQSTGKEMKKEIENRSDEDYEFLQVINGKTVEGFYHDELILSKIYELTDLDLNGYAMGPLERAISMITAHLQIENHQKMFFTHGVASRGLLVIQGDVTPNKLRELQAQWTNQVTGPQSAWRTPILAGIKGVQWEPLTIANRDMEYAAYQDHVIRTMHAVFAIDPEETGFGYLSRGVAQKSLSESSNEWKVTASRDRGLRPILARIEAIINEQVLPVWKKEYAEKYKFCFVGLDAEDRMQEVERLQAEVQLHTTIDEAREQADLEPIKIGGGLILNPLLLQTLASNMYKGEFMEKFLGVEGASQRPDLQYIPDQFWFQWQQFQMQMMQQQAQAEAAANGEQQAQPGEEGEEEQEKGDNDKEAGQQELQAQQNLMAQSQLAAIDKFVSANPELFKSMNENLKKSSVYIDHAGKMRSDLTKEFDKASERMMKEIFSVISDDIRSRGESSDDNQVDVAVSKSDAVSPEEKEDVGDFLNHKGLLKEEDKKKKKKNGVKKKDPSGNK